MREKRQGYRHITIKLVSEDNQINIIGAYAPKTGPDESVKSRFWEKMDGLIKRNSNQ